MAKIFYVEKNPIHRELTANHLERRAHEVVKFIPEYYFHARPEGDGSEFLNSIDDFVARLRTDNPEILILNPESFREINSARDYIVAVIDSGYAGRIVLTYTDTNDLVIEFEEHSPKVRPLIKPFFLSELDQILASD